MAPYTETTFVQKRSIHTTKLCRQVLTYKKVKININTDTTPADLVHAWKNLLIN